MNTIVRVAISNNFNCTPAEFEQLDQFRAKYPNYVFFVNSNIKTPQLLNLNKHNYPAVITVNPDLTVNWNIINRIKNIKSIAFLRLKWLPNNPAIEELGLKLVQQYPVVITLQRFNSYKSLEQFTESKFYKLNHQRFRLHGPALKYVEKWADTHKAYICDRLGLGCQGCGLCSKLVTGMNLNIKSLNLSSSGVCPYHCPDCYAKTASQRVKNTINFDHIHKNAKQAGKTKHIQQAQKEYAPKNKLTGNYGTYCHATMKVA